MSAGAFALALCSGCLESQAESEVPVVTSVPPPVSVISPAAAPAIDVAPAAQAEPGIVPSALADQTTPQEAPGAAEAVSTNAVKMVQPVRPPENLQSSPVVREVMKLAEAGVSEDVLLAYVTNSVHPYQLTSDEILYLNDLGVSTEVITAMLQKNGSADATKAPPVSIASAPAAPPAAMNPQGNPGPAGPPPPANGLPPAMTEVGPEQAATVAAQPQQPVTTTTFYSSLAPYGNWVEVPEYGLVWQPTVVVMNPTWRPYSDRGRWMWTDCGWYWYSDYSWGWAPFHYGRWSTHPRLGWIWAPDVTWGASWVSWRYTSSYCGWAPLPPRAHYRSGVGFSFNSGAVGISFDFGLAPDCYTFVPANRFHYRNPRQYAVPARQTTTIYRNSVVINNYVSGNNNTVVNRGFGKEPIVRATGTDLRTVNVRQSGTAPLAGRGEQLANNGNTIVAARPPMQQHAAMRNSLQASRAAAFSPAPAAPAVASTPASSVRNSGGGSPGTSIPQNRTGGRAQPLNLAKADAPQVARIPGADASPSSVPRTTPNQNGTRGPVFTPAVGGSQQQRVPLTTAPAAVQANPFAGAVTAKNSTTTPRPVTSVPNGSNITPGAERAPGARLGAGGFTRPNVAPNQAGGRAAQPLNNSLARNNATVSEPVPSLPMSRPAAAAGPPYAPRMAAPANPSGPAIPSHSYSPAGGYNAPPSYSPPAAPSAPVRTYSAPPSSNPKGDSSGSARGNPNGRGRQEK
ncbi:MAG: hypothetical protein JWM16_186 [Verrucomicrobiales bacterium]|nr:hypothetical protein [Verrucomicrobiales bacterium]